MSIKVIGDLHTKRDEPFNYVTNRFLTYLADTLKNGDSLLFLGDLFDTNRPYPNEYADLLSFFSSYPEVTMYILGGNHDYHRLYKSYSIFPLSSLENVEVITKDRIIEIEGLNFLFLPWIHESSIKQRFGVSSLKEYYETIALEQYKDKRIDYLLYHFEDEKLPTFGGEEGIDLSLYPAKRRIGGHIHIAQYDYLGTPYQTRYDERGKESFYISITDSIEEKIKLPNFIEYLTIDFEEEVEATDCIKILTVKNAPSSEAVFEKFKGDKIYIRDYSLTVNEDRSIDEEVISLEEKSTKEFLHEFIQQNSVDSKTSKYLFSLL
jgi:DNA repair exonuclease SbcCD nuclease subunit